MKTAIKLLFIIGIAMYILFGGYVIFAAEDFVYVREECTYKKVPEKYSKDGRITKNEAILIAKEEIANTKYKDCFKFSNPEVGYDKQYKAWGIQFKPKKGKEALYCYGVMINENTGEVIIGDFEGL